MESETCSYNIMTIGKQTQPFVVPYSIFHEPINIQDMHLVFTAAVLLY